MTTIMKWINEMVVQNIEPCVELMKDNRCLEGNT